MLRATTAQAQAHVDCTKAGSVAQLTSGPAVATVWQGAGAIAAGIEIAGAAGGSDLLSVSPSAASATLEIAVWFGADEVPPPDSNGAAAAASGSVAASAPSADGDAAAAGGKSKGQLKKEAAKAAKAARRKKVAAAKADAVAASGEDTWDALFAVLTSETRDASRLRRAVEAATPHASALPEGTEGLLIGARERLPSMERVEASVAQRETEAGEEEAVAAADTAQLVRGGMLLDNSGFSWNGDVDGQCPICHEKWSSLSDASVAVLECGHATCAACLCHMRESVPATEERQDPLVPHGQSVTTRFQCPHCTLLLDPATVDNLALQAYQASDLLRLLAGHLATAVAPGLHDAVPAMLVHRRLDAAAVEKELFEIISRHAVGAAARTSGSLDSRRKQEVYLEARRPVVALQRELEREAEKLATLDKRDDRLGPGAVSAEWRSCRGRCDELREDLRAAQQNAAASIFATLNDESLGMGSDAGESEGLCIDLHGLHVAEAKAKFDELVVPVLPVLGRCVVVTGRGSHSKGGEAALREALVRHARHRALRCEVMQGNGGALEISLPVLE
uniref:Smr domain-containing protein n=1 Tax=Emiliania huxleyi TaxID=2903 RepID=A0A7S3THM2_EMIHU